MHNRAKEYRTLIIWALIVCLPVMVLFLGMAEVSQ